jgi:hypothetical protein
MRVLAAGRAAGRVPSTDRKETVMRRTSSVLTVVCCVFALAFGAVALAAEEEIPAAVAAPQPADEVLPFEVIGEQTDAEPAPERLELDLFNPDPTPAGYCWSESRWVTSGCCGFSHKKLVQQERDCCEASGCSSWSNTGASKCESAC